MNFTTNPTLVSRFASIQPDTVMPASTAEYQAWAAKYAMEAALLRQRDPLLHRLLSGTAPASELNALLTGAVSPVAPSEEETAEAQKSAEVQRLFDQKGDLDLTGQMTLMHLDQKAYDTWAKNYKQAASAEDYQSRKATIQAERDRAAMASRNGFTGRIA